MPVPQQNAVLTKVEREGGTTDTGFPEDYDRPATDPEAVTGGAGLDSWVGAISAYYTEQRERTEGSSGRDVLIRRSLILGADDTPDFHEDDTVTFDFGGTARSGRVQAIEEKRIPEIGGITRLTLVDA